MFAVIETGAKQYNVTPGQVIKVEKISAEAGSIIELSNVMMVGDKIGSPYVEGAKVLAEVLEHKKTEKVIVFKKKRRHNYRRKHGHRQQISVLKVTEIKA